jgi:hypothetical protein
MPTLLESISFAAEKVVKKKGRFDVVLYVTQDIHGHRKWFEGDCFGASDDVNDDEILGQLADQLRDDFKAAGVVAFSICWLATRTRELRNQLTGVTETLRSQIIIIEQFDNDGASKRCIREIITLLGRPTLGALQITGTASDSMYRICLQQREQVAVE